MGLLTTYLAYRYGRSKERRRAAREEVDLLEVCTRCGFRRFEHAEDIWESCP
jgi:hypothetical protein